MKNKLLMFLVLGIFLITPVMALDNLGTGSQGNNFTIVQVCNDATFITLSSIQFPDRTTLIVNQNMTSVGSGNFQYNLTNTTQLGRYDITGISDGCENTFAFSFMITPTGHLLDTSQSLITFGLIIILIFLTITFLYFGNKTEYLPFKIFLTSLGILFIMLTIGVSLNAVKQLMIMGDVFSGTFVSLYRLMLILVSGGGIGLILYIIVQSLKQFYRHRGMTDDDDDD